MQKNLLHLAVECASGIQPVADLFGISRQAVSGWVTRRAMPVNYIVPLCNAGGNIITADQLTTFLADQRAEQARARTLQRAKAAAAEAAE